MRSDYKWELVIYPDATNYNPDTVLEKAKSYFTHWAYILHDKDKTEDGSEKKAHIHFYGILDSHEKATPQAVSYITGLPLVGLANVNRWRSAIRYLTHIDYPDKAQYTIDKVTANFPVKQILQTLDDTAGATLIWNYIKECGGSVDRSAMMDFVLDNNLWSQYRRAFAVFNKFIR